MSISYEGGKLCIYNPRREAGFIGKNDLKNSDLNVNKAVVERDISVFMNRDALNEDAAEGHKLLRPPLL